ncbi:MAG: Gfo/Idh/MocA family oxidoreductase [Candidatus Eremiobacterota bacterium]
MTHLKLGILGMSECNGHPYSWSAIFNGYNPDYMKKCPFPVIPEYLFRQKFPEDKIKNATVDYIWTQDKEISEHIAKAANIKHIVDNYIDMIGKVDAILLARDDPEFHYEMSKPFLEAGLPVYIDKPLSVDVATAKKIYSLQRYKGQIFSCSAITFAREFQLTDRDLSELGQLKYVDACVMKSWEKYGIHIIEPVLKIIGERGKSVKTSISNSLDTKIVTVLWEDGFQANFISLGKSSIPIIIRLFGTGGYKNLIFQDTFYAFKSALQNFVNIVLKQSPFQSEEFVLRTIEIIERGMYCE